MPIILSVTITCVDIVEVKIDDTINDRVIICADEIELVNKPSTFDIVDVNKTFVKIVPADILNDDIELKDDK